MSTCKRFFLLVFLTVFLAGFFSRSYCLQKPSHADQDKFSAVRSLIVETLGKKGVPSITVAVAKDGKIIWEEGFGYADLEKQVKAAPDIRYPIFSVSKPMTATGLMILAERGLVDLNKPANEYLGSDKLTAYVGRPADATVKRLLLHTAGLPMHWNIVDENDQDTLPPLPESIRRYGIMVTAPGEVFNYSNLGYGILGHIIERVSGKSYTDFLKSEVFAPLGMTCTTVGSDPALQPFTARRYDAQQKPMPAYDYDHRGASAVYASAHDLVRFGMFHLKNHLPDQKRILKDQTIDAMQHEFDPQLPVKDYSLGWSIISKFSCRMVSHSGGIEGVSARLTILPEENLAVVVLSSHGGDYDVWEVEWAVLQAMLPKPLPKPLPEKKDTAAFVPPAELIGDWQGEIKTYAGVLPVKLRFDTGGDVVLNIAGQTIQALKMETPLGRIGFTDGVFSGPFLGSIQTPDTSRSPHVLFLSLRMRGNKLNGYAAAIAVNRRFCLASWMEVTRTSPPLKNE